MSVVAIPQTRLCFTQPLFSFQGAKLILSRKHVATRAVINNHFFKRFRLCWCLFSNSLNHKRLS